jgi:hypothetical protein
LRGCVYIVSLLIDLCTHGSCTGVRRCLRCIFFFDFFFFFFFWEGRALGRPRAMSAKPSTGRVFVFYPLCCRLATSQQQVRMFARSLPFMHDGLAGCWRARALQRHSSGLQTICFGSVNVFPLLARHTVVAMGSSPSLSCSTSMVVLHCPSAFAPRAVASSEVSIVLFAA